MRLHILRHAKTEISSDSGKDFDRILMNKGLTQANIMGSILKERGIEVYETYCSDASRALQTAQIVSKFINIGRLSYKNELYLADREMILALLWKNKHNKDILIIGHNEGLSRFAAYLTDQPIHLKTCEYLCVEFQANAWKETSMGTGKIIANYRPQVYLPEE
jgi:phosphohistidine phosphatase